MKPHPSAETSGSIPLQLGPYRVIEPLGRGGMGTVYLAEQEEPVRRRVALKVIDSIHREERRTRFAAECQALARLSHPNVASLYEVGATDEGHPYVAMEVVEGAQITSWCDEHKLDLRERIKLFFGVCAGVRHAHEKGILHRDLKPSNVLVADFDGRSLAKVIDFGIARALDTPLVGDSQVTLDRELVGSPAYMSPEAVTLGAQELDTRSDVYALGLLLFELLVGARPFETEGMPLARLVQRLASEDPPAGSERFAGLESSRRQNLASLRGGLSTHTLKRRLGGDLDAILRKATARDRNERYSSPADLAADLERYLDHEPVEARSPTALYLASRFIRRRFGVALGVTLLFLALAGGFVARTAEARRTAAALDESEAVSEFFIDLLAKISDPRQRQGNNVSPEEVLDRGAEEVGLRFADQPRAKARFMATIGAIYNEMGQYERAAPLLEEALQVHHELLPPDHPRLAANLHEVGLLYRHLGKYDEAEQAYKQALAIWEQTPGTKPTQLAETLSDLGRVYLERGNEEEAEPYMRRALELKETILGAQHPDLAAALDNLGAVYFRQGNLGLAEPLRARALAIREKALEPNHPDIATSLNNLGVLYRKQGRLDEAVSSLLRALEIRERVLGPEHPNLASTLNNIGRIYVEQRNFRQAEPILLRALEIKRTLGPNHPQVANTLLILAHLYSSQKRYDEAEPLIYEAAAIREKALGPDHLDTVDALATLAKVLANQGRQREAEPLYVRAIEALVASRHPEVASITQEYATLLRAQGRDEEAEALSGAFKEP